MLCCVKHLRGASTDDATRKRERERSETRAVLGHALRIRLVGSSREQVVPSLAEPSSK